MHKTNTIVNPITNTETVIRIKLFQLLELVFTGSEAETSIDFAEKSPLEVLRTEYCDNTQSVDKNSFSIKHFSHIQKNVWIRVKPDRIPEFLAYSSNRTQKIIIYQAGHVKTLKIEITQDASDSEKSQDYLLSSFLSGDPQLHEANRLSLAKGRNHYIYDLKKQNVANTNIYCLAKETIILDFITTERILSISKEYDYSLTKGTGSINGISFQRLILKSKSSKERLKLKFNSIPEIAFNIHLYKDEDYENDYDHYDEHTFSRIFREIEHTVPNKKPEKTKTAIKFKEISFEIASRNGYSLRINNDEVGKALKIDYNEKGEEAEIDFGDSSAVSVSTNKGKPLKITAKIKYENSSIFPKLDLVNLIMPIDNMVEILHKTFDMDNNVLTLKLFVVRNSTFCSVAIYIGNTRKEIYFY